MKPTLFGWLLIFGLFILIANLLSSKNVRMTARRIDNGLYVEARLDSIYKVGDTVLLPLDQPTKFQCIIVNRDQ